MTPELALSQLGLIQPEGSTIINVDNRQLSVALEAFSTPAIRFLMENMTDAERLEALEWLAQRRALAA